MFNIIPHRNAVFAAVAFELDQRGIAFEVQRRGKHPSVHFDHGGKTHRIVLPLSPSDRRAPVNARAFVRRILKETTISMEALT